MLVSIVLPTYNERDAICSVLEDLLRVSRASALDVELIVVDDSSPDGTASAVTARFGDPAVHVHRRAGRGLAGAIRCGIELARGDVIVLMDSDGNHDPSRVPAFVDALPRADLVVGSRFVRGGGMPMSRLRHLCSLLFNRWACALLRLPVTDCLSGFLCFRPALLAEADRDAIFTGYGDYAIHLLSWVARQGFKVLEVPVSYGARRGGLSKTHFLSILIRYSLAVLRARRSGGLEPRTTAPTAVMARAHASFLRDYLVQAPIALAVERSLACELFRGRLFRRPVLDIGCGDGLFTRILFGPGQSVCYGLDLNERELSAARRRGGHRELLHGAAQSIPLPDRSCRTILSNSVLDHIAEIEVVLEELHRVLADDGELLITVPTDLYERYSAGYQMARVLGLGRAAEAYRRRFNAFWRHYHCYAPQEWKALLERSGFETVEMVEYASRRVCIFLGGVVLLAGPSVLLKKLLNRWVLWPQLRLPMASLLSRILRDHVQSGCSRGGLVFLRAVKSLRARASDVQVSAAA